MWLIFFQGLKYLSRLKYTKINLDQIKIREIWNVLCMMIGKLLRITFYSDGDQLLIWNSNHHFLRFITQPVPIDTGNKINDRTWPWIRHPNGGNPFGSNGNILAGLTHKYDPLSPRQLIHTVIVVVNNFFS